MATGPDGERARVEQVVVKSDCVGGLFVWAHQLERRGSDVNATLEAFTHWLWSGNGFSQERYAKLGLERCRIREAVQRLERHLGFIGRLARLDRRLRRVIDRARARTLEFLDEFFENC